jgi:hypothetical protein
MRKAFLLLLPLVAFLALHTSWRIGEQARWMLRDSTEAGLARSAADFLTVVTPPGTVGEFDAVRLLSGVHALAGTSFWPGGLQVVVGSTALLPDSLHLLPLSDSLLRVMDDSPPAVAVDRGEVRVLLVPLRARSGSSSGAWIASWGGATASSAGPLIRIGYIGAAGGIMLLAVLGLLRAHHTWRWSAVAGVIAMIVLIRAALGLEWEGQLRTATELRLRTIRNLVEIAATAPGVRQVTVPGVAASAEVFPYALMPKAQSDVVWTQDSLGAAATILAATPRTLSGLKIALHPPEPPEVLTGRVMPWLLLVLLVALVQLLLSGLSSRPAIFQGDRQTSPGIIPPGTA